MIERFFVRVMRLLPRGCKLGVYRSTSGLRRRLFAGSKVFCPVCESHLRRFAGMNLCPVCASLSRHRFAWVFFRERTNLFRDPIRFLHIAPEPGMQSRLERQQNVDYVSADLSNPLVTEKMDITDIRHPDDSFDAIYCSHVLEHVPDDRQATREFHRVLKPGGWAVILVPTHPEAATLEDPSVSTPAKRRKRYGHSGHVRLYGQDFPERLSEEGFDVQVVSAADLAEDEELESMGLIGSDVLYFCTSSPSPAP